MKPGGRAHKYVYISYQQVEVAKPARSGGPTRFWIGLGSVNLSPIEFWVGLGPPTASQSSVGSDRPSTIWKFCTKNTISYLVESQFFRPNGFSDRAGALFSKRPVGSGWVDSTHPFTSSTNMLYLKNLFVIDFKKCYSFLFLLIHKKSAIHQINSLAI